jgi:hypothetical protein
MGKKKDVGAALGKSIYAAGYITKREAKRRTVERLKIF